MNKLVVFLIVVIATLRGAWGESNELSVENTREKRLLFYDEEGNLVKTYNNPLRYDYTQNAEKIQIPMIGKFLNPFLNFVRPSFGSPTVFMIPVSDAVIRHLYTNPDYQNKLLNIPRKELVVGPNSRCEGKRTQIPVDTCHNFLNCWDGWAMEQECPEGLLFSREGYCDYEHNVDCSQRDREPSPPAPVSPQNPPFPAQQVPSMPEPQSPVAVEPPQPPQPPVSSETPPAPQPPPSPAPQCNNEYETWRDAHNCSQFYVCVDRTPVKFQCPADLAYSQEYGVCDYKDRVNCNSNTNQPGNQQAPGSGTMCSTPAPEAAKLPPSLPGLMQPILQYAANRIPDGKTFITSNAVYNTQSWSSSHVALSRQDALRKLKLGEIANVVS